MTKKKAERLILKWLNALSLDKYTVQFTVEKPTSIQSPEFIHRTENACVLIEPNKGAHIMFNSDNFRNMTEETIIHECCHIMNADLSNIVESSRMSLKNKDRFAKAEELNVQHWTRVLYRKKKR